MGVVMRGWVELDAMRLLRVRNMTLTGGRAKTKVTPAGSTMAVDTNIGPQQVSGTLVVYGTEQDGYEFDWLSMCNGESVHTLVRHHSATERRRIREVEFSTFEDPLPDPATEASVTLNFVGTEVVED